MFIFLKALILNSDRIGFACKIVLIADALQLGIAITFYPEQVLPHCDGEHRDTQRTQWPKLKFTQIRMQIFYNS
jgi:hypothetical protein